MVGPLLHRSGLGPLLWVLVSFAGPSVLSPPIGLPFHSFPPQEGKRGGDVR